MSRAEKTTLLQLALLGLILYAFLVSIGLLGSSFKLFGKGFAAAIISTTSNPLVGLVATVMVQSSSITTSMVVPLVGAGILTVEAVFPYTLGANVGTTVTAMLASMATGNVAAVTVAFAHLFFNVTGVVLVYPVPAIRRVPIRLAQGLARLTSRNRLYAILYVALVFYLIPLALIFLWD